MLSPNTRVAIFSAVIAFTLSSFAFANPVQKGQPLLQFVDLHYVSEEAGGIGAVRDYAAWLDKIMRRHGGRVIVVHEVRSIRLGNTVSPRAIFRYEIADIEALRAVIDDPEYQAGLERRNALFDFSKAHSFGVAPIFESKDRRPDSE